MDMENTASTQLNHHYDNKKTISATSDNVEIGTYLVLTIEIIPYFRPVYF